VTSVLSTIVARLQSPPSMVETPRVRVWWALLPWLIAAVVLVAALLDTGTPARDVALYAAYFAFAVVLPGTLVHRALRGSRGNLPEDFGLGAATGLLVVLIGWALAAATGLQVLLPGWPLLVLVLFAAVPGLRRHWRIADRRPLPLGWSWIVAGALIALVVMSYPGWLVTPLPPVTTAYYQDTLYHLALVHEMMRSMPFQVPQLAGDTLRYHYLSDADMAAASMITRISPATVIMRLWIVPMAGVTIFVIAAIIRELSGKWWAGALGGAVAVIGVPLSLGGAVVAFGNTPVSAYSPSQTYVLPLLGMLLVLAIDLLRGRPLGWAWVLVFPLALASTGAKSSALPPLIAGLVLAGLVLLVRERRRLPAMAAFLGLILVATVIGLKAFAGGGAGTLGVQPFAILWWFPPYRQTLGRDDILDGTRALPLGVENASAGGVVFLVGIVVWWLLLQSPRLLGVLAIGARDTRRDPVVWMFAGFAAAGFAAAWLFWHPAASQIYFFITIVPFGVVLTVWFLADRAPSWRPVVVGLVAGGLFTLLAPTGKAPTGHTLGAWAWAMAMPVLRAAIVALVLAGLGLAAWRLATGRYAWRAMPIALVAALLGGSLGSQMRAQAKANYQAIVHPSRAETRSARAVLKPEATAALWLDKHAGEDDVVATNVHCQPLGWRAACDARAFWVAGFGGRRTVVESWGYTDQAIAQDGVNGKRFALQPAPYPDRFALNQRVFADGKPADVAALRDQYHVRWLFADSRAQGGVSPLLAQSATLRYADGPVTIYQLP
jgi:hypothetical protein